MSRHLLRSNRTNIATHANDTCVKVQETVKFSFQLI